MVEAVWGRLRHSRRGERREPSATSPIFVVIAGLRWAVAIALLALTGWGLASEARTSYLQSRIFSHFARETSFSVEPGPSETIVFPKWGPYDERLGYTGLPFFIASLSAHGFAVERQAEWSPPLTRFVDQGGYALYGEKPRAGLKLFDREQNLLYQISHPEGAYPDFASIPPLPRHRAKQAGSESGGFLRFVEDTDFVANSARNRTLCKLMPDKSLKLNGVPERI